MGEGVVGVAFGPGNPTYDSASRPATPVGLARQLWQWRSLVRLLFERDLTLRYRRSVLGVGWTLLNPLLTMGAMWLVFSAIFRFQTGRTPYLVYLFSGIIVISFFQMAVVQVGSSLTASSSLLARVRVPPQAFAVSAALAALVSTAAATLVLLVLQLTSGAGIPWTIVFAPLSMALLAIFATGCGLVVATLAVRFYDTIDLTNVLLLVVGWVTPTFYPESIIPARYAWILHINPVAWHLAVFRDVAVYGTAPSAVLMLGVVMSSVVALAAGALIFTRSWRSLAVML